MVAVDSFRAWLAGVDVDSLTDRERVELVAGLERVKGASSAVQARAADALRCSREVVAPQDVARSVGSVVALARRESPTLGDRFVGLSRALVHEMPVTMAALSGGECSERVAVAVVAATATLSLEDRGEVDARVGPLLSRLGVRQAGAAAARVAAELDAASVVARMEAAARSRRVSVRPAPDGMAYLTVLGPLKDVVGAHAAVQARARGVVGGQCPDEPPEGRGVGAVAADTALRLLSGRATGQPQPVEVQLVMTDRALLGTGNGDRSVFEPARIPGHGSVPAAVARAWLLEGLDAGSEVAAAPGSGAPTQSRDSFVPGTVPASGEIPTSPHEPAGRAGERGPVPAATPIDPTSSMTGLPTPARVWVRRLYTTPDGRDLVAMDSRRRVFGGMLRRMLVLRDDVCTTPWCEAPIVHADHATPVREHAETSFEEGNGKCARCNYAKEAPGWRTRVILADADIGVTGRERTEPDRPRPERANAGEPSPERSDADRPATKRAGAGGDARERTDASMDASTDAPGARRVVRVTTPLGHTYDAEPPPLLGWGSQSFAPTTTAVPATPARPDQPSMTSAADAANPERAAEGSSGISGDAAVVAGLTSATDVLSETAEPTQHSTRPDAPRRPHASGWPRPGERRKRALRRPRTLSGTATERPRPGRRPRLTSHLERELCRYLS